MRDLDQMIDRMKAANKRRAKTTPITPAQLKTLAIIREKMLSWGGDRIWKRWDVRILASGKLGISAEVGHKDDSGTMAALFCRDRWHLFIGRRGGLIAFDDNRKMVSGWKAFYAGKRS